MQEQSFREREDLQRILKGSISVIEQNLLILAEEFSQWEDSRRRVDFLALDREGSLVVIELKRTEDGGHMELQAVRYAAMVSTLSFQQAVNAHAEFLKTENAEAEAAILEFLGESEPPEAFGQTVRIVLVSPGFSPELTTAVLWLNSNGLDIRCVRIRPYQLDGRTLLEIDQIIPLREAQDYTVRLKEKQEEARHTAESKNDYSRYDLTVNGQRFEKLNKRRLIWQVIASAVQSGLNLDVLSSIIPARKMAIVDGHPRGDAFLEAAQLAHNSAGFVFEPKRFFIDDDHLIDFDEKTMALSKMWGLPSLPLLDEIIRAVPSANISYKRADCLDQATRP